jgi:hypothetical protein
MVFLISARESISRYGRSQVTVVLSMMNDEAHVRENLAVAGVAYPTLLTEAELQLVKRVESTYRELMKVACTGCRYCMPCPYFARSHGVPLTPAASSQVREFAGG